MNRSPVNSRLVVQYGLLGGCVAIFALFMVWPIILTVSGGFYETASDGSSHFTLRYIAGVFSDPVQRQGLINSLIIAVCVTLLCLLISIPLSVIATGFDFRGKAMFSALLLVPMILPPFVGVIGLRQLMGRFGAFNALLIDLHMIDPAHPTDLLGTARLAGVIIMEALHLYPIIYLNATASLANLDPALAQAAENLGASRWTRFTRVTLPLILPGLFAGGIIVFIWSFTELGTPLMFDYYETTAVQVFWGIQEMADNARPYALVAVMLGAAVLLYASGKLAFGGKAYAMATRAGTQATTRKLTGLMGYLAAVPFVIVTLLAVMPHIGVILASFCVPGQWYQSVLPTQWTTAHYAGAMTHPLANGSIHNSLLYSCMAVVVDIVLGLMIAWLIVRSKVRGRWLLDSLAMLPLAVPGLVLAFGYVALSLQIRSVFRAMGGDSPSWLQIVGETPNPIVFLVIAYAIRRLPYVVRAAVAGLQQTSGELEEAAVNLGASPLYAARRVIIPLILANLIAGGLLAFSFAMLEVSDSLILAQTEENFPITKAIYSLFERLGDGPYIASAMGVWGMALLTVTLVGASVMIGKKLGSIFRV
ncbi:MAG: ABC transporter permease subunit [Planctomycetes bacterium]|nr:ABC transporter permease subunit [Planctomycetota bacterium]